MSREKLHLTVAAVVHYQGQFLLVEEKDKLTGLPVLNQPAGHVEENEDLITAACRELYEETGLQLQPVSWLGISQLNAANGHNYVRINFVFEPTQLPLQYQPQDSDILALHWLTADDIIQHALPVRSELVSDAIQLYQRNIRLPLDLICPPR